MRRASASFEMNGRFTDKYQIQSVEYTSQCIHRVLVVLMSY